MRLCHGAGGAYPYQNPVLRVCTVVWTQGTGGWHSKQQEVRKELPTPFVIPWTWFVKQRLQWAAPKTLSISVDVDGQGSGVRHSAVLHTDPQVRRRELLGPPASWQP